MEEKNKIFIHFNTYKTTLYKIENSSIIKVNESKLFFNETLVNKELFDKIDNYLYNLNSKIKLDNKNTRLYATGLFQELSSEEQTQLNIYVFVKHGLYLNIIPKDLENFYLRQKTNGRMVDNLIEGLLQKEFRRVVICGSFQKNMSEICDLMKILENQNVEILSPWTKDVVKETLGTDFILLEGQTLENERDSWRHKYDHMNKFKKADAVIVCNPTGIIGKGTMFEFGFITACNKRIIFTNEPKDLSVLFPYEIGLNKY